MPRFPLRSSSAWLLAAFVLLAMLPICAQAAQQELHITNIGLDLSDGSVQVVASASLENEPQIRAMLRDGASLELLAQFKLERVRAMWSNSQLAAVEYAAVLRLNPLTREFLYYPPGQEEAVADRSLSRLLAATWQNMRFTVAPLSELPEGDGSQYRVEAAFTLRHAEAPPWLPKAFALWSRDVAGPVEYRLPFTR